jgi:Mg2+-importing ATPase
LGLVSTLFDFIFFLIFYKHSPATIQTLWFIESILTEIFLIFVIRTRHLFWKAKRPSFALLFFTVIDGLAIIILPFTKFGQRIFHFVTAPWYGLLIVFLIVVGYIALSELVKLIYFHYFKPPKPQNITSY